MRRTAEGLLLGGVFIAVMVIAAGVFVAHAQTIRGRVAPAGGFLGGTLGPRQTVSMSLAVNGETVSGFYYYDRIGIDIPLRGTVAPSGEMRLEERSGSQLSTGRWSGTLGSGFSGRWRDPGGKRTLAFALEATTPLAASPMAFRPLQPGGAAHAPVDAGAVAYQLTPVRKVGVSFPRLVRAPGAGIADRVNHEINRITADFGCEAPTGKMTYFELDSVVTYADQGIFSIFAEGGNFCGGAHPDETWLAATFDLRNGEKVGFAALFRDYEHQRDGVLTALFAERMRPAANRTGVADGNDANCADLFTLENLRDTEFTYAISTAGLIVVPVSWPHVVAACAEPITVAFAQIKAVMAPSGLLARLPS